MEAFDGRQAPTSGQLIGHARELLTAGVPREEAAAKLADLSSSRAILEDAHIKWAQTMHWLSREDFMATQVLRTMPHRAGAW